MLECPDSLGEKLENAGLGLFLKTRSINSCGKFPAFAEQEKPLHLKWGRAYRLFREFHRIT